MQCEWNIAFQSKTITRVWQPQPTSEDTPHWSTLLQQLRWIIIQLDNDIINERSQSNRRNLVHRSIPLTSSMFSMMSSGSKLSSSSSAEEKKRHKTVEFNWRQRLKCYRRENSPLRVGIEKRFFSSIALHQAEAYWIFGLEIFNIPWVSILSSHVACYC